MNRPICPQLLVLFQGLLLGTSIAFSQTPENPPPGVPVPPAIRTELEAQSTQLREAIRELQEIYRSDSKRLELVNDVIVYYNAVHYALIHNQFYPDKNEDDFEIAFQQLKTGRDRAESLKRGKAPWIRQTGLVVRGYRSRIDDSVQPYGLVIPDSFDFSSKESHRLDIWYHGRGNTLSELKFIHQRESEIGKLKTDQAIVLHPYGRYCNANKFAGEADTFEAIESVRKQYPIDPGRITVRGFSMGGAATWHMAAHHADKWAAAAPGAGFAESAIYAKVMEKDPKPAWYELALHNLYDATKYAANLAHCPTIAYSGSEDKQKQAADIMAEYMEAEGLELPHVIGDGMGHKYDDLSLEIINRTLDEWAGKSKDGLPRKINFVTYTLRYNTMHWLTIDALEEHWKEARVTGEVLDGSKLRLTTNNVTALTINFPIGNPLLRSPGVVSIQVDQTRLKAPGIRRNGSWTLSLVLKNGTWMTPSEESTHTLTKRHGLQGPIDDAFMDSFIFVLPSGEESNPHLSDWVAAEAEDARVQWWRQFRGEARVKRDIHLTRADIENHHLVLWGDPSGNQILKRIQGSLPFTWNRETFSIHGQTYNTDKHLPVLIYPNPLNPKRYIVLNSGFTFSEFSGGTNSLQIPKLPDWAVLDMSVPRNKRHPGGVVDAGFFDEAWEYESH